MFTFGIKVILLILLIGGATAIIGNYIGRVIGRRHIMILSLRPRHTANLITILTGILIAFFTMVIILVLSQDARTALFGLDKLRQDAAEKSQLLGSLVKELDQLADKKSSLETSLATLRKQLDKSQQEITALAKAKNKLNQEVQVSRLGQVLFKVDEVLLISLIKAGPNKAKLETGLKQIISAADDYVRNFNSGSDKYLIYISPHDFDLARDFLAEAQGDYVAKVTVTRNTLFGEEVPVRFNLTKNKLIYRIGQTITETTIAPGQTTAEIEQAIKKLLALTHLAAKGSGIIPNISGSVGKVTYEQIFSLAKRIKLENKTIRLQSLAKTDTYSIGPLEIDFKISR